MESADNQWSDEENAIFEGALIETGISVEFIQNKVNKSYRDITFEDYCIQCKILGFDVKRNAARLARATKERRERYKEEWRAFQKQQELRVRELLSFLNDDENKPDCFDEDGSIKWEKKLKQLITKNLDIDSIYVLISIVAKDGISEAARAKALKLHAEHHRMKLKIYEWMDEHYPLKKQSLDDWAGEISGSVVKLKWRAVRQHITEWKKLRSAGRT